MINDYELYFTPAAGQLFNATDGNSEYGEKNVDQKAARYVTDGEGDWAVFYKVVDANSNVGTSLAIALVEDDDGAGTNEVVLLTATVLVANLTTALGVRRLGNIPATSAKKVFRAKVTTAGAAATAGKVAIWIGKNRDSVPANAGRRY